MRSDYDIAIIGAGDVGAAIARELARFELRIALFDSGDVGAGTSKANTALLHVGFDSRPGTLEARLLKRGQRLLMAYAAEVGIPVERTGALLVAWTPEELARLSEIDANARACGYEDAEALRVRQLYRREPTGPRCAGGAGDPGRGDHLPVDHAAGVRDPGCAGRRRAAALRAGPGARSARAGGGS